MVPCRPGKLHVATARTLVKAQRKRLSQCDWNSSLPEASQCRWPTERWGTGCCRALGELAGRDVSSTRDYAKGQRARASGQHVLIAVGALPQAVSQGLIQSTRRIGKILAP